MKLIGIEQLILAKYETIKVPVGQFWMAKFSSSRIGNLTYKQGYRIWIGDLDRTRDVFTPEESTISTDGDTIFWIKRFAYAKTITVKLEKNESITVPNGEVWIISTGYIPPLSYVPSGGISYGSSYSYAIIPSGVVINNFRDKAVIFTALKTTNKKLGGINV